MTLIKVPVALTACVLAAVALSGCAPEPGAGVPDDNAQPKSPAETSASVPATENRTATGVLTSSDGQTSGRVEVQLGEFTDDSGITTPIATVEFYDLVTPYDHLTPGGALAPRGDDPCFDTGIRSGGGMITPDENGFAVDSLPAEDSGHFLYEIVLHLDWTQVDSEVEACMQPVVARAPLTWTE
ncbi:MAG: hypothetical protein ACTHZ9_06030 [Leucobacter sp.]